MDWFWFAIISPAFLAITNIIDKFIISKSVKYPIAYSMLFAFIQFFYTIFLLSFFKIQFSYPGSFIAIASGMFWLFASFTYSKAMKIEEATKVLSLLFLSPILTTFLAAFFLNEILTPIKYVGIIVLVSSAILISHKKEEKFRVTPVLKIVLLGLPLYAMSAVMEKASLNSIDFISLYFWSMLGAGSLCLLLLASDKLRLDFGSQFFIIKNKKFLGLMAFNEFIALLGFMAGFYAISQTYVSYVSSLTSIQPFFLFLFSLIASLIFPHIIKEELNRKSILIKLVSVLLIFAGGWLIIS